MISFSESIVYLYLCIRTFS